MRKLYFDTVLYTEGALRLLIESMGADRCLFGSECPGVGSGVNPKTGHYIAPLIAGFDWLSAAEKKGHLRRQGAEGLQPRRLSGPWATFAKRKKGRAPCG